MSVTDADIARWREHHRIDQQQLDESLLLYRYLDHWLHIMGPIADQQGSRSLLMDIAQSLQEGFELLAMFLFPGPTDIEYLDVE